MRNQIGRHSPRLLAIPQMAAEFGLIVHERDLRAGLDQFKRRLQSRGTAANHRDFRVHPRVLVIRRSSARFRRDAKAGYFANIRLGCVPGPFVRHGLVVPTHRHQPIEALRNG